MQKHIAHIIPSLHGELHLRFAWHNDLPFHRSRLHTDARQNLVVSLGRFALEILEDLCAAVSEAGHGSSVRVVVAIGLEVVVEVPDAVRQYGGLDLGRAGILLGAAKVVDDATDVFHLDALAACVAQVEHARQRMRAGALLLLHLFVLGIKRSHVGRIGDIYINVGR